MINVDNRELCEPDVLWDLEKFPYPWEDSSVDKIIMSHVLEHLEDPSAVLLECSRILKWGGLVEMSVHHCSHDLALGDRFHKRIVNNYTVSSGSIVSAEDIEERANFSFECIESRVNFDKGYSWLLKMPKWVKLFAIDQLRNIARESVYILKKVNKNVTITFDDGPSPYTPRVLDKLKEFKIKATFFVLGINAEKYPEIVQRIVDEGHTLGIHGYDHSKWVTKGIVQEQVTHSLKVLKKIVPDYKIEYFRPPFLRGFGTKHPEMLGLECLKGLCIVDYSTICEDWKEGTTLGDMLRLTKSMIGLGAAILFHDGYYPESEYKDRTKASEVIFPLYTYLASKGYNIKSLKELEDGDGESN